jgi:hypothetical protein
LQCVSWSLCRSALRRGGFCIHQFGDGRGGVIAGMSVEIAAQNVVKLFERSDDGAASFAVAKQRQRGAASLPAVQLSCINSGTSITLLMPLARARMLGSA